MTNNPDKETFRFLNWNVYQDSQNLFTEINTLTKKLPRELRFEITNQLLRCSLSVVLNIAEGSGKESDKELNRYLEISLGSLYETLACLDILLGVEQIDLNNYNSLKDRLGNIASQIGGFKKSLSK